MVTFQIWRAGQDPSSHIPVGKVPVNIGGEMARGEWFWRHPRIAELPDDDPVFFFTAHSAWCPPRTSDMLTVKLKRSEIEGEEEAKAEEEAQVEDAEEDDAVEDEDEQPEPEILSVKCLDKEGKEISKCPANEPLMFEAVCNDHVDEGASVTFNVYCEGDDPEQDEPVETFSAAVRQNRARFELNPERVGILIGAVVGGVVGGKPGIIAGGMIGRNIARRCFVTAESAGCEEVQSECVEVEENFNPYESRTIRRFWRISAGPPPNDLEARVNTVRSNPGFAPLWEEPNGRFDFGDQPFTASAFPDRRFADPTLLFNNLQPGNFPRHAGLDFRGTEGRPIHSFIHGRVINMGWFNGGNGRILVIANEQEKGIYILAHLFNRSAPGIQRGAIIEPSDIVAYVGGSGSVRNTVTDVWERRENRWDPHLHLEYYHVQYEARLDIDEDTSSYVRVVGTGSNRRLVLQNALTLNGGNRRNPFDHSERQL
jgi:murein DD-endopeptidase MepM/ murein hydrolase activator NlpD